MSACACRYCAPAAIEETTTAPAAEPVALPSEPRRFRVHTSCGPQDCTLHPDGRITMVAGGQLWRAALTFEEMLELDWAGCHIEWDPTDDGMEPAPSPTPVQTFLETS